jgi:hypothetical protein
MMRMMQHVQWSTKNLSFTPARSFLFQPRVGSGDRSGLGKRDSSVAVVSINLKGNNSFRISMLCKIFPNLHKSLDIIDIGIEQWNLTNRNLCSCFIFYVFNG